MKSTDYAVQYAGTHKNFKDSCQTAKQVQQ